MNKQSFILISLFMLVLTIYNATATVNPILRGNLLQNISYITPNIILTFREDINTSENLLTLLSHISSTQNSVGFDSILNPEMNVPASITFRGIAYKNPIITQNDLTDPTIPITRINPTTFLINVNHWTNWGIIENNWNGSSNYTIVHSNGSLIRSVDASLILNLTKNESSLYILDNSYYRQNATTGYNQLKVNNTDPNNDGYSGWVPGKKGLGLNFSGSRTPLILVDFVRFPAAQQYNINRSQGNISFMGWIKTNETTSEEKVILKRMTESGAFPFYSISIDSNTGNLLFKIRDSSGVTTSLDSLTSMRNASWHHFAIVRDNRSLRDYMYIDGTLRQNMTYNDSGDIINDDFLYLGSYSTSSVFNGSMDYFRMWNRVLRTSEISNIYNAELIGSDYTLGANQTLGLNFEPNNYNNRQITDNTTFANHGWARGWVRPFYNSTENAYWFDGNQTIIYNTVNNFPTENITISMWIDAPEPQFSATANNIFSYATTQSTNEIIIQALDSVQVYIDGTSATIGTNFTKQGRQHLVMTWQKSDGNVTIYKNGTKIDSSQTINPAFPLKSSGTLVLGTDQDAIGGGFEDYQYYNGFLSNVAVFNRVLQNGEIKSLYDSNGSTMWRYVPNATYTTILYNTSNYNPGLTENIWNNLTFTGDVGEGINTYGQAGNCTNLSDYPFELGTRTNNIVTFSALRGNCFKSLWYLVNGNRETITHDLEGYKINSTLLDIPILTNISIYPPTIYVGDTIYGNATWIVNDTITTGSIIFEWYVNKVLTSTQEISSGINGTVTTGYLTSGFSSLDVVNYTVRGNNSGVFGNLNESSQLIIGNRDFSFSYSPTTNITLRKPKTQNFVITIINDSDGDLLPIQWFVKINNGPFESDLNTTPGIDYIFHSTTYNDYDIVTLRSNLSDGSYYYSVDWQVDVYPREVEMVGSIALTIFILFVAGGLFGLPFYVGSHGFVKNQFTNLIFKRACWIIAIYLMMLNSAIMATIASASGLDLTREMFSYMYLFGWAGYLFMGFFVLKTFFDVIKMWKVEKKRKQMGEEEEDYYG